ncbi:MAG: hypothetical protein JSS81_24595 [Acidobacteria bacterium]|nr:hypothetical protein [Acidobacteriota bacterium]
MRSAKKFLWASFFFLPLLVMGAGNAFGVVTDDYTPEVTARVVRLSFIRGDVQIRHASADNGDKPEWERAALNLPLVEGDEVSTGPNAVVEIQLDSSNYIRLWENAYLKFTTLRDEGVAISLPQGTASIRVLQFDKDKTFFEADAPGTTVSLERAGMYRIDAGDTRNSEISVTAAEDGEAKVYTKSSGFTLRSGRTAKIVVEGQYAGDYETSGVARVTDEFDEWVLQRDAAAAKRLNDAYYDKYYDRDIYGAEDLNDYGEWVYTNKYGYVWKPYPNSVANYAGWSPYRYGSWRWVPFYGWTWVNDEPWGWATYHHGRWVWDNGYWVWSPYGYYRWRRSWWQPAMISITTWNGSVYWFPLGYDDYYYDYNVYCRRGGRGRRDRDITIINNTTVIVNPTPSPTPNASPTPPVLTPQQINEARRRNATTPTFQRIPIDGVVAASAEEFGRGGRRLQPVTADDARRVLSKTPEEIRTPPILPTYDDVRDKIDRNIRIEKPRIDRKSEDQVKTGAADREKGRALDKQLEQERIYGNRRPKVSPDASGGGQTKTDGGDSRGTGAVDRKPVVKRDEKDSDTSRTPDWNPRNPTRDTGGGKTDGNDDSRKEKQPVRPKRDENQTPPIYSPPSKPKQDEERRPQPTIPRPKQEEPRRPDPPKRDEPRQQPQPKQEPPRNEPKPEKPAPPPVVNQKKNEKDDN